MIKLDIIEYKVRDLTIEEMKNEILDEAVEKAEEFYFDGMEDETHIIIDILDIYQNHKNVRADIGINDNYDRCLIIKNIKSKKNIKMGVCLIIKESEGV
ncbi:hypothetical protein [uncultured Clostridium sp.]|uniref:hypothetical protein n=1 Tax=uncultured Clostridium sp. TaxID=59620 RepID=UPI0032171C2B